MRFNRLLHIFAMTLSLTACKNSLLVEINENNLLNKPEKLKLICIDPKFYFDEDEDNYKLKKTEVITTKVKKGILKAARNNEIDLALLDFNENSTPDYYNRLIRLKKNMLAVNLNKGSPFDLTVNAETNKIQKKVLVYPPQVSFEFNTLSKDYGTPYFSYVGIYSYKRELVLYHIVVDTDLSETVYRELKVIHTKSTSEAIIGQMIYDSYVLLKKELVKKQK